MILQLLYITTKCFLLCALPIFALDIGSAAAQVYTAVTRSATVVVGLTVVSIVRCAPQIAVSENGT